MRFLLKYPSRSRPCLFKEAIDNWEDKASRQHHYRWLISADRDDPTMNNDEICKWCAIQGAPIFYGDNHSKVEAVNADMDKAGDNWDVLVLVSDDMLPVQDWDQTIADNMPADLNCGLWFPDGMYAVPKLCTLSVMGKPVYDTLGYIYHPDFISVWCDNHYHWLLTQRGQLKFVDVMIARHAWQEHNADDLMKRNESRELYKVDRATFERLTRELI